MTRLILALSLIAGGAAWAHQGVQNPGVMARMNGMSAIADSVKVIGTMARGRAAFDAEAAQTAALEIAAQARLIPELFEGADEDPKSEARPAIWANFEDFVAQSEALEALALDVSQAITSQADLGPALARLGENCKACHEDYRE